MSSEVLKQGDNEMTAQNKDDIPKIIDEIIKVHGADSASLILDGLLANYNPDLLINILRTKIKENNEKSNSSFIIGLEVYLEAYIHEIKQKSAIKRISDKYGMTENTVKTHIDNFRKFTKEELGKKIEDNPTYFMYSSDTKDTTKFINDFVRKLYDMYYGYIPFDRETRYNEPERKKDTYKHLFENFMNDVEKESDIRRTVATADDIPF